MYCSGCGAEMPEGLNYCSRCGASLNAAANVPAPLIAPMSFTKLALIIGFTLVLGMITVFASVDKLLSRGVAEPAVVLLAMLGLVTVFGVSGMLIRLWSKISGLSSQPAPRPVQQNRQQGYLEQPRAAQLPPRPANFGSVTDHTTRTFDPILRDSIEQRQ
jgi:hypothetical protein